jgi:hypothetical protein
MAGMQIVECPHSNWQYLSQFDVWDRYDTTVTAAQRADGYIDHFRLFMLAWAKKLAAF